MTPRFSAAALALAALLLAPAATAQEGGLAPPPDADPEVREGLDLLGRGMEMVLEGLMDDMAPALGELSALAGELRAYHPPEVLPNGDIILRRRVPLDVPEPGVDEEVEL